MYLQKSPSPLMYYTLYLQGKSATSDEVRGAIMEDGQDKWRC